MLSKLAISITSAAMMLLPVQGHAQTPEPLQCTVQASMALAPGSSVGSFGPAGAGKTTLIHTLSGLNDPSGKSSYDQYAD